MSKYFYLNKITRPAKPRSKKLWGTGAAGTSASSVSAFASAGEGAGALGAFKEDVTTVLFDLDARIKGRQALGAVSELSAGHVDAETLGAEYAAIGALEVTGKRIYFGDTSHYIELDENGFHFSHGLYSESFVSALGLSSGGSGEGGGASYDRLDAWGDYTSSKAGWVLSAALGYDLHGRVAALESAPAIDLTGYAEKADTLQGYGITDAYTKAEIEGKLADVCAALFDLDSRIGSLQTAGSFSEIASGHIDAETLGAEYAAIGSLTVESLSTPYTTLAEYGIADAYTKTETDAAILQAISELFVKEAEGSGYRIKALYSLYSEGYVSALGAGSASSAAAYDRLDSWGDYTADKSGWVLSAALGQDLNSRASALASRVTLLESSSGLDDFKFTLSGEGNAVTGASWENNTLALVKGATFLSAAEAYTKAEVDSATEDIAAVLLELDSRIKSREAFGSVSELAAGHMDCETAGIEHLTAESLLVSGKKIWFDEEHYIELDAENRLHTNCGFYSDSFVSALGLSASQGISVGLLKSWGGSYDSDTDALSAALGSELNTRVTLLENAGYLRASDLPSSLKNPCALTINGVSYDGSTAVAVSITAESIGALTASSGIDWSKVANKPSTLGGYGITDAYTSSQVDGKIADVCAVLLELDARISSRRVLSSFSEISAGHVDAETAGAEYLVADTSQITDLTVGSLLVSGGKICFGDSSHYIEIANGAFHFSHGLYSDSFVSALGIGSVTVGGGSVSSLSDVQLSGLASGDVLRYNGSHWVNVPQSSIVPAMHKLTLSAGTFSSTVTFDPSQADAAVSIPKTTDHISEGSNKYYTDARVASKVNQAYIKTTLGISDWALAATKPSYSFSELASHPTTLAEYGITDAYTKAQADAVAESICAVLLELDARVKSRETAGSMSELSAGHVDAETLGAEYAAISACSVTDLTAETLAVTGKRICFGTGSDSYLELDSNGYFHFSKGLYSDSFVSALGCGAATVTGGSVSALADVQLGGLAANDVLRYNGTKWVNVPQSQISPARQTLTFQAGAFSAKTYDTSAAVTVSVPTTTAHISESGNLYFTEARAQAALAGTVNNVCAALFDLDARAKSREVLCSFSEIASGHIDCETLGAEYAAVGELAIEEIAATSVTATSVIAQTVSAQSNLSVASSSSGSELLTFSTERPWAFWQEGAGAQAALALKPDSNDKSFKVEAYDGTVVAQFYASSTGGYFKAPSLRAGAVYSADGTLALLTVASSSVQVGDLAAQGVFVSSATDLIHHRGTAPISNYVILDAYNYFDYAATRMELGYLCTALFDLDARAKSREAISSLSELALGHLDCETAGVEQLCADTAEIGSDLVIANSGAAATRGVTFRNTAGSAINAMALYDSGSSRMLCIGNATAKSSYQTQVGGYEIVFMSGTGPSEGARLKSNGQLVVGPSVNASLDYRLTVNGNQQVNGDFYATGAVTALSAASSSDIRLKRNIERKGLELERIASVSPATFEFLSEPGRRHAGVIAQELLKVLPEAVTEGAGGMLAVEYGNAAMYLALSLAAEVKRLKEEIFKLKNDIQSWA